MMRLIIEKQVPDGYNVTIENLIVDTKKDLNDVMEALEKIERLGL